MIEITKPTLTLTLEGEDVDKFKKFINSAQRDRLYSWDADFARELAGQLGMELQWPQGEEIW